MASTVCFNQSSDAFTFGVIGFTRVVTVNVAGVSVHGGTPEAFAGQILDSDTLFNNSGPVSFATPTALSTSPGAYDLESLLTDELGHYFGLDDSAARRAILYPFAPPPGTYIGDRPTASAPDGPLADDDRTGLRRSLSGSRRYDLRRHDYKVYVEPLDGLATSEDFSETSSGICNASGSVACTAPAVNTNFTTRGQPAAQ